MLSSVLIWRMCVFYSNVQETENTLQSDVVCVCARAVPQDTEPGCCRFCLRWCSVASGSQSLRSPCSPISETQQESGFLYSSLSFSFTKHSKATPSLSLGVDWRECCPLVSAAAMADRQMHTWMDGLTDEERDGWKELWINGERHW